MLKFLLVVIIFAVTVYVVVRFMQERGPDSQQRRPRMPRRPSPPSRPMAPDDDDEFLRDLERKRRHRQDPDG